MISSLSNSHSQQQGYFSSVAQNNKDEPKHISNIKKYSTSVQQLNPTEDISFQESQQFTNLQMQPSPYFIAPYMPPVCDYNGVPFEPFNYENFLVYNPHLQLMLPMATSEPYNVFMPPGMPTPNAAPVAPPGNMQAPEVPLFGPGPPIVTGERLKGPRGCNLFVFHLPNEITNWDLYLLFRRHGTILSVHIMVNKSTGLSKGYGFVSYAYPDDARSAIQAMDGFRLGKKRLKVQLKRLQDDNLEGGWEDSSGEIEAAHESNNELESNSSSPLHAMKSPDEESKSFQPKIANMPNGKYK